jgi:hypothetical protein
MRRIVEAWSGGGRRERMSVVTVAREVVGGEGTVRERSGREEAKRIVRVRDEGGALGVAIVVGGC